ncbi:MAG TPA: DUF748 domain-containing protein [Chitinophagales bacterium]|nr:DUF748 domain-containing protein [Chitinophagales bacterium]
MAIFFVFLLVFISPLAKYLIEKYDDKILGRTIEVSWVYVNPFTGYVYLKNIRVLENDKDTVFFRANAISADLSMLKLLKKNIEISTLTVYRPWGHIVQNKRSINFEDIIAFYKPKDGTIKVNKKRLKFSILDCSIKDGTFQYDEVSTPVTYFIKHVNVYSPGKWWDADTMLFNVSLESGPYKGTINGNLSINFKTQDYRFGGAIDTFDVKPLSQYMRVLSNYGDFGGILNARIDGEGNFKNKFDIKTAGLISINQFQFGPSIYEDYGSFQRLVLDFSEANPAGKKYRIDSIMLDRPYFRYERYDSLDNLSLMFGKRGSKKGIKSEQAQFNLILKIAEYLQQLLRNFAQSDYKIDKFTVYKGNFVFKDFNPVEKFTVDAMPVHITGDSINKSNTRFRLALKSVVRPYGDININISLDPKDYGNFDIDYGINNVPVSVFNPYLITYTSFPLSKGKLQLNGHWHVVDSSITSTNHLLIINPQVGKRMKHRDNKWIPLPLIMSIAREAGQVIDYEIPVKGNLRRPEFDLKYVILDVVRNIFIKPPMTPYLMQVKQMEKTVDKMLMVDWDTRRATLNPVEHRFLNAVARHLQQNPEATVKIAPLVYEEKEKEQIAYFEGKKKYYLAFKAKGYKVTEEDSMVIEQMSTKDPAFIRYLNNLAVDTMMFSTEQKCRYAVGDALIEARFQQLNKARQQAFLSVFKENQTSAQVKFIKPEMGVPFNGFSRYKIDYNGDIPERLQNAYEAIEEANMKAPRKKHKGDRWLPKVKGIPRKGG